MNMEVISARPAELGESPVWSAAEQTLYWVDIPRRQLHAWQAGQPEQVWTLPELLSAVVPGAAGELLLALERRVALFRPQTGELHTLAVPDAQPGNRSNDGRCDPLGRFWLGTMQNNLAPDGSGLPITRSSGVLCCIEAGGRCETLLGGIGISNGLAFAPDGGTLYFADSLRGELYAYDLLGEWPPQLGSARVFPPFERGVPDGSAVDSEGYIWNARWGGGCVVRFTPQGEVDRVVDLPVTNPSSCAFGGPDLEDLFVTSARSELTAEVLAANPLEGAVLRLQPGVRGLPGTPFGAGSWRAAHG